MAHQHHLIGFLRVHKCFAALAAAPQRRLVTAAEASASRIGPKAPPTGLGPQEPPAVATVSAAPPAHERLPLAVPAYGVWGANTNVGKTLVSVGLAHAAAALKVPLSYIKPIQTGFPADSDARLVALACGGQQESGAHAAHAAALAAAAEGSNKGGSSSTNSNSNSTTNSTTSTTSNSTEAAARGGGGAGAGSSPRCTTLFAWQHAVSPHLAVRLEGRPVSDEQLVDTTAVHVRQAMEALQRAGSQSGAAATAAQPGATAAQHDATVTGCSLLLLETAGGVTSPAPSGRLACDVLRPLRLPALLVGDPRLGGIAATLSAYDSLAARGWDVEAVVLVGQQAGTTASGIDGGIVPLDNLSFIREHFGGAAAAVHRLGAPPPEVLSVPACPPPPEGHQVLRDGLDPHLRAWLSESLAAFTQLLAALQRRHQQRVARLFAGRAAAEAHLWWPFTQHAGLTQGSATLVDGRCGESWTALSAPAGAHGADAAAQASLVPLYDASGSWWTQAATPALQPEIARAVSYAAGRYLHVLFAEVAHEPALRAAAALLRGPGAGWAERVFFSDDGSTAVEVALKMAFRKFLYDRGELGLTQGGSSGGGGGGGGELLVLGLQGAYHGDTLGAQDCVAPSVFNGPLQAPWYRGRGLFLEPLYVGLRRGRWQILDPPAWLAPHYDGELPTWASLDEMMSAAAAPLAAAYGSYIDAAIDEFEASGAAGGGGGGRLAACIMEPLLQGAGGMLVLEPGFQKAIAETCRRRRLPLILDEVFSGLYRTGSLTAAAVLGITPDIACYGKLLTGGAAPMAVTLASREVFEAFSGPSKLFALLHGHSYTAYPIGCAAAAASLELLTNPETNPNLCAPCRCPKTPRCDEPCGRLLPIWDERAVSELSYHPLVSRVAAVGTVLAVELTSGPTATHGSGYGSMSTLQVVRRLRDEHGIYARPLGSVVYLMVPPTSPRETAAWLAGCLRSVLDAGGVASAASAEGPEESVVV